MNVFHCHGTCWEALGGIVGFHQALWAESAEIATWFADAGWVNEIEPSHHAMPLPEALHSVQGHLIEETVEEYRTLGPLHKANSQKDFEAYPTLFRWHGNVYIFQGTHRIAALRGQSSYFGWFVDLDELTSSQK